MSTSAQTTPDSAVSGVALAPDADIDTVAGRDAGAPSGRPGHRRLRLVAVAGLAVTSVAHMPVTIEHLQEGHHAEDADAYLVLGVHYLALVFAGLVVAAAVLAGSLLVEDSRRVWRGALALSAAAVLAYVVSRSVGLPQAEDDLGDWANPLGVVCVVAQLVVVAVALVRLRRRA